MASEPDCMYYMRRLLLQERSVSVRDLLARDHCNFSAQLCLSRSLYSYCSGPFFIVIKKHVQA